MTSSNSTTGGYRRSMSSHCAISNSGLYFSTRIIRMSRVSSGLLAAFRNFQHFCDRVSRARSSWHRIWVRLYGCWASSCKISLIDRVSFLRLIPQLSDICTETLCGFVELLVVVDDKKGLNLDANSKTTSPITWLSYLALLASEASACLIGQLSFRTLTPMNCSGRDQWKRRCHELICKYYRSRTSAEESSH